MNTFESITERINALNLNVYDLAIISDSGVYEHVFTDCNPCNNSYSVAKSFIMTGIGILYDQGKLTPEMTVAGALRDAMPKESDLVWSICTIDQVLRHRIGFQDDCLDIDSMDVSAFGSTDYLHRVLTYHIPYMPGTHYTYTDAGFYLLSRIIEKAAGIPADRLLQEKLLNDLQFQEIAWSRDPNGHIIGATGLYARARDIAKLGWLYANNGRWNGKQLLSEKWIQLVLSREYEFSSVNGSDIYIKGGLRGQALAFSRDKHLAICWHAVLDQKESLLLHNNIIQAINQLF